MIGTHNCFFLKEGFRVVAHDRRGHGRSSQVWDGHDMDHYADDVAEVVKHLNIKMQFILTLNWWWRGSPLYCTSWSGKY